MKIGTLRHRVELQSPTEVRNTYGQPIATWETVATFWAEIQPLTVRELVNANQVQFEVTHRIRNRYFGPISARQRIVYEGRIFNIIGPRDIDERHREYQLLCMELPPS